ncbi:nucleotidyltransferase domain-containing protein [Rhizobium ruizarguesonis]|uniref:nucleotidyltransferase domain-containing protein n=1 Tax=Rhizobium ruizarguesonis TaxID=2081791 RepID=UPI0010319917|nr:nucleotidyltransferase domain-containing protein [Rhizobium ruizarguesonis]TAZ35465.1 nucleotidyltransferase domain-containing protein [Rhizobium ruizarguesonis]
MSLVDFLLSRRQQKMLAALLVNPRRQYGSNELVTIGGPGYGAGKRALDQFASSGLVVKTARGNQRLYSINTEHPVFAELRSICIKTFGMGETIAEELAPFRDRISLAFVFGSIARGTDGADSDVDLMVVGHIDAFELGETIERIERKLGRSLDLNLHLPEEWEALKTDRVVAAILGQPKIMLHGEIPQPSGAQPATRRT